MDAPKPSTYEQISLCSEVIACHALGDEIGYMKHLKKAVAANNSDAQRLLAAFEWLTAVQASLAESMKNMRVLGREHLANFLSAVVALPSIEAVRDGNWHMCNITGMVSTNTIVVPHSGDDFHVDARFRFLVSALWVAWNFQALENARVVAFTPPAHAVSIQERVQAFLDASQQDPGTPLEVYTRCVDFALESLRTTLDTLSAPHTTSQHP